MNQKRIIKIKTYDDQMNKLMIPFAKLSLEKVKTSGSECPNGISMEYNNKKKKLNEFDMFDYSDPLKRYFYDIKKLILNLN